MKKNIIIIILIVGLMISLSLNVFDLNKKESSEVPQSEYNSIICEKKSIESNNRNIKMEFIVDKYGVVLKTINTAEYVFTDSKSYNYYKELYQKYEDSNYSYDDENKKVYYTVIEEYSNENKIWAKDYVENYINEEYLCK